MTSLCLSVFPFATGISESTDFPNVYEKLIATRIKTKEIIRIFLKENIMYIQKNKTPHLAVLQGGV